MPFVNIKLVKGQATHEQIEKIIEGITELIVNIMGRDKDLTVITIDELKKDHWAIGGKAISCMPKERIASFVNIKVSKGTTNSDEMSEMMRASKNLMKEVLGSTDETNYFIIDELNPDGWGYNGLSMSERGKLEADATNLCDLS